MAMYPAEVKYLSKLYEKYNGIVQDLINKDIIADPEICEKIWEIDWKISCQFDPDLPHYGCRNWPNCDTEGCGEE